MTEHAMAPRQSAPRLSPLSPMALVGWLLCLAMLASDQWLLGPALALLMLGWITLLRVSGPPVIAAAFTYQWLQVTIALIYFALTGRAITEMLTSHYEPMVLIGLASVTAYFGGYYLVSHRTKNPSDATSRTTPVPLSVISISYVAAIAVSIIIQRAAWSFPSLTQLLIMLGYARYVLLYVLTRRLLTPKPQVTLLLVVLGVELAIGFAGYFATFREPLVIIGLAILASANRRSIMTWLAVALVVALGFVAAVTWTAIKPAIRKEYSSSSTTTERLQAVAGAIAPTLKNATTAWDEQVDKLISRMWMIYFPALTLERVPASVPFEHGAILRGAVMNTLMPRIFFPGKGILPSESEKVRKYAGVWVAGRETSTSFAFGYAAESYVDFGWPLLLVPIFLFGALLGGADRLIHSVLKSVDIRDGVRVVVLWSSMYLFETSWVIMIGTLVSLFVVLVGGGVLFERGLDIGSGRAKGSATRKRSRGVIIPPNPQRELRRRIS